MIDPVHALSLHQLTKTYANGKVALKGISLHVEQGEFFALLGPNGAGKSTTIGIVASLVRPSGGLVTVFGERLDQNPYGVKQMLGVVPQEINFNPFEKVEHILYTQGGYFGLSRLELRDIVEHLLHILGLADKRQQQAKALSGGMKRRLLIARGLVHRPRLLILDEPTAGLDVELRLGLWGFLEELNRSGTTIILTTHYLEEAERLCRQVAIIDHGEIIANAAMRSLLDQLDSEVFVLYLCEPLAVLSSLGDFGVKLVDPRTLEVCVGRDQNLNDLFALLAARGIVVHSMRNKQNRLEALFTRLVGIGEQAQPATRQVAV